MADWSLPTIDSLYVDVLDAIKDRADSQATLFGDGVTWTNLPTNTIRWSSSNDRFELWNGSTWNNLSSALTGSLKAANNLNDLASAATARSNLGLGAIALEASPLSITKGGTGETSAAGARTALGLGTLSTQNLNSVGITGGDISNLASLSLNSGADLSWGAPSGGDIQNLYSLNNPGDMLFSLSGSNSWLFYWLINGVNRAVMSVTNFYPYTNEAMDLGSVSNFWAQAYVSRVICEEVYGFSSIALRPNQITCWTLAADGDIEQDPTNGANIVFAKAGTGIINEVDNVTAAGSIISDGTVITHIVNYIDGGGANTGVRFLDSWPIGLSSIIWNLTASDKKIWPPSGGLMGSTTVSGAYTLASGATAIVTKVASLSFSVK